MALLDPATRQRIQALLQDNRVVLFMKGEPRAPQCGFSASAAGALDALGVPYAHVDVLADAAIREGIKQYGEWPTIPQLYIDGELVGGADIIGQMAASGQLHEVLGLPAPDRTPPGFSLTPAATAFLRKALDDAGDDYVLRIDVDGGYNARLQLAQRDPSLVTGEAAGIVAQFDLPSAQRARGMSIDFVDDARGRGLVIDNPNAPPKVRGMVPEEVARRVQAGSLLLVDVRPPDERARAEAPVAHRHLDHGVDALEALPKDTAIAFLCRSGGRSAQAAEHFRQRGFREVYNVSGGINAWALIEPRLQPY